MFSLAFRAWVVGLMFRAWDRWAQNPEMLDGSTLQIDMVALKKRPQNTTILIIQGSPKRYP